MYRSLLPIALSTLALFAAPLRAADPQIRHRFLCSDYSGGQVCIVDAEGGIQWRFAAKAPQDCWMLPNGNVLFSHADGAKEVTEDKQVVWEYQAPKGAEVHAAQPLPDGNVLVAECGTKRLVEVDRSGAVIREVPVHVRANLSAHMQFRGARKLANGNYLVAFVSDHRIAELDASGAVVRELQVPGNPVQIDPLPNGNLLVTCGYARKIQEMSLAGDVLWSLGQSDLLLHSITGAQRLRNGNTVICNWLSGESPQIYEVTPDKQLVWSYANRSLFKGISQVRVLDDTERESAKGLQP